MFNSATAAPTNTGYNSMNTITPEPPSFYLTLDESHINYGKCKYAGYPAAILLGDETIDLLAALNELIAVGIRPDLKWHGIRPMLVYRQ